MVIKDTLDKRKYRYTDEFRMGDLLSALNIFGNTDQSKFDKWRCEEEQRQNDGRWRSRTGKARSA